MYRLLISFFCMHFLPLWVPEAPYLSYHHSCFYLFLAWGIKNPLCLTGKSTAPWRVWYLNWAEELPVISCRFSKVLIHYFIRFTFQRTYKSITEPSSYTIAQQKSKCKIDYQRVICPSYLLFSFLPSSHFTSLFLPFFYHSVVYPLFFFPSLLLSNIFLIQQSPFCHSPVVETVSQMSHDAVDAPCLLSLTVTSSQTWAPELPEYNLAIAFKLNTCLHSCLWVVVMTYMNKIQLWPLEYHSPGLKAMTFYIVDLENYWTGACTSLYQKQFQWTSKTM